MTYVRIRLVVSSSCFLFRHIFFEFQIFKINVLHDISAICLVNPFNHFLFTKQSEREWPLVSIRVKVTGCVYSSRSKMFLKLILIIAEDKFGRCLLNYRRKFEKVSLALCEK